MRKRRKRNQEKEREEDWKLIRIKMAMGWTKNEISQVHRESQKG